MAGYTHGALADIDVNGTDHAAAPNVEQAPSISGTSQDFWFPVAEGSGKLLRKNHSLWPTSHLSP